MKRFFAPMFWIFLVFLANAIALYCDIYPQILWLDVPMHFFGGYTVALFAIALYSWIRECVTIKSTPHAQSTVAMVLLEGLVVMGFVMIISVAWEIWEFLMDQFSETFVERFGAAQPGVADTMSDFVNDGIGAMTAWLLWRK